MRNVAVPPPGRHRAAQAPRLGQSVRVCLYTNLRTFKPGGFSCVSPVAIGVKLDIVR